MFNLLQNSCNTPAEICDQIPHAVVSGLISINIQAFLMFYVVFYTAARDILLLCRCECILCLSGFTTSECMNVIC